MKRTIAIILALLLIGCAVYAEPIDFDAYSLDELREMQRQINAAMTRKQAEELQQTEPVEGVALRDLFEDKALARLVRDELNVFSVDDAVTQAQLDAVTELRIPGGTMLSSIAGISHLRNLETLEFATGVTTVYGAKYRISDPDKSPMLCTELPDEIGLLTNLRHLSFHQTRFEHLPDSMRNLINLETFCIRGAEFNELPDWIAEWTQLKTLEIWQCFIKSVPDSIGTLANLTELRLTDTDITTLPDSLCDLPNLRALYLNSTQLSALPDNIGNMATLQSLDIAYTPILELPESIRNLHLSELNMKGTSIE